jgi:hypothetical protein
MAVPAGNMISRNHSSTKPPAMPNTPDSIDVKNTTLIKAKPLIRDMDGA